MITREELFARALDFYGARPEYLWADSPGTCIFRRGDDRKWFAALLDVPRGRLGLAGEGKADLLNLKCGPELMGSLLGKEGFLPAYHMNKAAWIGILLDGPVPPEDLFWLLDVSYGLARAKKYPRRKETSEEKQG